MFLITNLHISELTNFILYKIQFFLDNLHSYSPISEQIETYGDGVYHIVAISPYFKREFNLQIFTGYYFTG